MRKNVNQSLPIIPVILCGGSGSRLWPLSRTTSAKQFLSLNTPECSMLQETVQRLDTLSATEIVIVCNQEHRFSVAAQMQAIHVKTTIILEPEGRNTAAAIAAAALHVRKTYGEALMLVLPSDHIIAQGEAFLTAVGVAANTAAEGYLVTFGITPEYAETGYGYIKKAEKIGDSGAHNVAQFVEKPDAATAEHYLQTGEYLWNSGMFMFPAALFCEELAEHQPAIMQAVEQSMADAAIEYDFIRPQAACFVKSPNISVDVAVMEATKRAAVVPLSCGWSDAGAWDALWRVQPKDAQGNVVRGSVVTHDAHNNYFYSMPHAPAISAVGVEGLAIISTRDMVMVAAQSHAQQVKTLLAKAQAIEPEWAENHTTVSRPWGEYEVLFPPTPQAKPSSPCKIKHITVEAGERLSKQMHHHRAEHWIIVQGEARVVVADVEHKLTVGGYVFIPQAAIHFIENIGTTTLYFVEVQTGGYLGEDDIVRFDDKYGRC
jgi:mannose-1-phosphate guanylyltransferase